MPPTSTGSSGPNCAFDFFPSSFSTSGKALMGLNAANEGFLRAFLRYGQLPCCVAHVRSPAEAQTFRELVTTVCGAQQPVAHLRPDNQAALEQVGALLHPFPGFGHLAWNRNFRSPTDYSLLGITHTTATQAVMDSIGNLAITPIQSWDAVVCTSKAVRHTYETVLGLWEEHLRQRLGATRLPRPQLPIIPLGVDTGAITPATAAQRQQVRQQLDLPAEAFVVLWVGRFNHTAKSHPIPAYLALEQLAQRLKQPVLFLQAGWFGNDAIEKAFRDGAQRWAPSVQHRFVDGREPSIRQHVWHGADVFLSLSDNLQETFGLTPIEAMAAELPVVVSDWDGYRDTVRDGIDGFRIPTTMPAAGYGADLARTFSAQTLSYDAYCGISCQAVAVDVAAAAQKLEDLASSPELRARLGRQGRQRALETYEWAVVISQYRQLLAELAERRAAARQATPNLAVMPVVPAPLRADPYAIFASYPTRSLHSGSVLSLAAPWRPPHGPLPLERLDQFHHDPLHSFAAPWRLPLDQSKQLLGLLAERSSLSLSELADLLQLPEADTSSFNRLVATIGWLLKLHLVELVLDQG
jgi:glycosyltransferase involved in cell wall biosynthesis